MKWWIKGWNLKTKNTASSWVCLRSITPSVVFGWVRYSNLAFRNVTYVFWLSEQNISRLWTWLNLCSASVTPGTSPAEECCCRRLHEYRKVRVGCTRRPTQDQGQSHITGNKADLTKIHKHGGNDASYRKYPTNPNGNIKQKNSEYLKLFHCHLNASKI